MITTDDFKNGMTLKINGEVYKLLHFQHVKPGKGGAFVRTKLKGLINKSVINKTFTAGERVEDVFIKERRLQYLYSQGNTCYFMDSQNFEQFEILKLELGEVVHFLRDNIELTGLYCEGRLREVIPPLFVGLRVVDTEPGVRGNTAKGGSKNARLETGFEIQVPLFVNKGDRIKIDTRTSEYVERVR